MDWHVTLYKRQLALRYLGTRHVLHSRHEGGVSHNPAEVNVSRTVKRHNKRLADAKARAASERQTVPMIGRRVASK